MVACWAATISRWRRPNGRRARATPRSGRAWWATPAPTHGPSLLDALTSLERGGRPGDLAAQYRAVMASIAAPAARRRPLGHLDGQRRRPRRHGGHRRPQQLVPAVRQRDRRARLRPRACQPGRPRVRSHAGHPNFPAPGRRPATTLHAWVASDGTGAPRFVGGTPGGANQMPWNSADAGPPRLRMRSRRASW